MLTNGPFGPFVAMPREWRFLYLNVSGLARPGAAASRMGTSLLLDGLLLAAAAWLALPRPDRAPIAAGISSPSACCCWRSTASARGATPPTTCRRS